MVDKGKQYNMDFVWGLDEAYKAANWSWNKIYRNTRYFCKNFCQKVRSIPFSRKFHRRKREFSIGKIENTKGILIIHKRILFFEGGIAWKRGNSYFLTRKFDRNIEYYGKFYFRISQQLYITQSLCLITIQTKTNFITNHAIELKL